MVAALVGRDAEDAEEPSARIAAARGGAFVEASGRIAACGLHMVFFLFLSSVNPPTRNKQKRRKKKKEKKKKKKEKKKERGKQKRNT